MQFSDEIVKITHFFDNAVKFNVFLIDELSRYYFNNVLIFVSDFVQTYVFYAVPLFPLFPA